MKETTQALLDQLSDLPWFEQVGSPVSSDVLPVGSWREAMESCKTPTWESVQLQVGNHLAYVVNTTAYDRFLVWNETTVEVNRQIDATIAGPVKRSTEAHRLSKRFLDCVAWDMTLICQEVEFSDVCPPIFFLDHVLPWYRRGHFPCGWSGKALKPGWTGPMPDGRLIVF